GHVGGAYDRLLHGRGRGVVRRRPGEKPVALFAAAGPGPVRAVRCLTGGHDCTVPAQRSASGRGLRRVSGRAGVGGARWTESGPRLPDDARVGLALDSNRELVAATFAPSTGSL